jgi:hypothetical protein
MLRKLKELERCKLGSQEGELGHVRDFYFDDQTWTIRYLVVDTGDWLPDREVLISPTSVKEIRLQPHPVVEVALTRQQIEASPRVEAHQPVSRQMEAQFARHYGWPYYWVGPMLWGQVAIPGAYLPYGTVPEPPAAQTQPAPEDSGLCSANDVTGYAIQALDYHFGHIEDLIFDEASWAIRYLVADTRNWWPEKRVLLSPLWISDVNWQESRVHVDFDRDTVKRGPVYNPKEPITQEYEAKLFEHYHREPYWKKIAA